MNSSSKPIQTCECCNLEYATNGFDYISAGMYSIQHTCFFCNKEFCGWCLHFKEKKACCRACGPDFVDNRLCCWKFLNKKKKEKKNTNKKRALEKREDSPSKKNRISGNSEKRAIIILEAEEGFNLNCYEINYEEKKIEILLNNMIDLHSKPQTTGIQCDILGFLTDIEHFNTNGEMIDGRQYPLIEGLTEDYNNYEIYGDNIKPYIAKEDLHYLIEANCLRKLNDDEKRQLFYKENKIVILALDC
jgi:hypothetical protein